MKQFKQYDVVVSTKNQQTNCHYAEIDINYISQNICTDPAWIYFKETSSGKGAYDIKNFRHATPEEIKQYEQKGPHVLEKEESLKGRWLKARYTNSQATRVRQGEYVLIEKDSDVLVIKHKETTGLKICKNRIGTEWELMPKEFDPLKQKLNSPLRKETYKPDDWVVMLEDYGPIKKGRVLQILNKQSETSTCWIVKHKEQGSYLAPYERIIRKALPNEIPKIENMEPKSLFDIGDIIDTDDTGYQYTDMEKLSKNPEYTWTIIRGCNVKTSTRSNIEILDKAYSPYTSSWWYNVGEYGSNWISENCISLHKDKCIKLPKKPEERKYSVGDYVVCIGDNGRSKNGNVSAGWEKNLCFVVKSITTHSPTLNILWGGGMCNSGVFEDQVRMATQEEAHECKIHGGLYTIKPKEDLVKEAERRYPIGTKFISFRDEGRIREVQPYDGYITVKWYIDSNGYVRADNGMRTKGGFCSNPTVYENGKWAEIVTEESVTEESVMEKWLRETKAKNMSLKDLTTYIENGYTCPFKEIYSLLEGNETNQKTEILYNKWYPEQKYTLEKESYVIGIDPYEQKEEQILPIKHQAPIILVKKENTSKLIIINK